MRLKAAGLALALVSGVVVTAPGVSAEEAVTCGGAEATIIVESPGLLTIGTDGDDVIVGSVSYTHLTLPTTPYV